MLIYKITNKISGKIYVGYTISTLEGRFNSHYNQRNTNAKKKCIFARALRKYDKYSFLIELLENCNSLEEMYEKEIYWIDKLNATNRNIGYNLLKGGRRGHSGRTWEDLYGKEKALEMKNKVSIANTGKKFNKEVIDRCVEGRRKAREKDGYDHGGSKISEKLKGIKRSTAKPFKCTQTGEIFRTTRIAASILNIPRDCIRNFLRGKTKNPRKHKNLTFTYLTENELKLYNDCC